MTTTCVYHCKDGAPCPAPATHRVVTGAFRHTRWQSEEVVEATPTGSPQGFQTPEFCLRHAGEVRERRNHP